MRTLRAVCRVIGYLFFAGGLILVQNMVFLFTKGTKALVYGQIFHRQISRLFGVRILTRGTPATAGQIVYVSNHISYADIPVLGSLVRGCFIAKKEIEGWPFFGYVGSMGMTAYISRAPADAAEAAAALNKLLDSGLPVILFPEGTSTDGKTVYPFKSSMFEFFLKRNINIQPITLRLIEFDGQPVSDQQIRDQYTWHGDMTLVPHLWNFAKAKGSVVEVTFHKVLTTTDFTNRKTLSASSHAAIAKPLDLSRPSA